MKGRSFAPALLIACILTGSIALVQAQKDPHIGTWKLDLSKSTFSPGPAPKSQTVTYLQTADGLAALLQGIGADGKPINPDSSNVAIVFDGKDHPTPMPGYEVSAWTHVDANTYRAVRKKAGKIVLTSTNVVSKDGKTMTITTTGVDADGKAVNNVRVFDRQ